jgi:hypothetical protein
MFRVTETRPERKNKAPFYVVESGVVLTPTEQLDLRPPHRWRPSESVPGVSPGALSALERNAEAHEIYVREQAQRVRRAA